MEDGIVTLRQSSRRKIVQQFRIRRKENPRKSGFGKYLPVGCMSFVGMILERGDFDWLEDSPETGMRPWIVKHKDWCNKSLECVSENRKSEGSPPASMPGKRGMISRTVQVKRSRFLWFRERVRQIGIPSQYVKQVLTKLWSDNWLKSSRTMYWRGGFRWSSDLSYNLLRCILSCSKARIMERFCESIVSSTGAVSITSTALPNRSRMSVGRQWTFGIRDGGSVGQRLARRHMRVFWIASSEKDLVNLLRCR